MIKVLVVDDSAFIRRILTDLLTSDKEIEVIGVAKDGREALSLIGKLKPDVITLDIEMPNMDGLTTLKNIVGKYDIPVIMISSLTSEGADLTLKALDEGAIDFLPKPTNIFNLSQADTKMQIIEKVKAGARSKGHNKGIVSKPSIKKSNIGPKYDLGSSFKNIIAIGTSTGGPRALQTLIPEIPEDINATILIVQHMPPKFTKSLAERLDSVSKIRLKEAEDGDILKRGFGYIAPGDFHMVVNKERNDLVIRLNQEPQVLGLRPTVDYMMDSVANIKDYKKIGVILTGMGSDGAKGIVSMKNAGSYIIAQDEASSVVFGMPKAAISTNSVDDILPLNEISNKIISKVGL